jgi:hypothetical protein
MSDFFVKLNFDICDYIYYKIIKSLITEYIYLIKEYNTSNYIITIEKNLFNAVEQISKLKKKKKKK